MNEYRIDFEKHKIAGQPTLWRVWSGRTSYGDFIKEEVVYSSQSISDCYAWVKANKEGLMLIK